MLLHAVFKKKKTDKLNRQERQKIAGKGNIFIL